MRKSLIAVTAILIIAIIGFFALAPRMVEQSMNKVVGPPPRVTPAARALHARIAVADLHADSLL